MKDHLEDGDVIDISWCQRLDNGDYYLGIVEEVGWKKRPMRAASEAGGVFFEEGKDLCDAQEETWIWSVGVHKETGRVYASTSTHYYQNPAFFCIFLR